MAASCAFYTALGLVVRYGGPDADFTSFHVGEDYLNIQLDRGWRPPPTVWGRVIFWVDDVDEVFSRAVGAGLAPEFSPRDAPWGERYFHIRDPDGHELSFARLLVES
jgi:catechol 2,3-dioxygenase-like lactoylglutathione lyase family enzyme